MQFLQPSIHETPVVEDTVKNKKETIAQHNIMKWAVGLVSPLKIKPGKIFQTQYLASKQTLTYLLLIFCVMGVLMVTPAYIFSCLSAESSAGQVFRNR